MERVHRRRKYLRTSQTPHQYSTFAEELSPTTSPIRGTKRPTSAKSSPNLSKAQSTPIADQSTSKWTKDYRSKVASDASRPTSADSSEGSETEWIMASPCDFRTRRLRRRDSSASREASNSRYARRRASRRAKKWLSASASSTSNFLSSSVTRETSNNIRKQAHSHK